MTFDTVHTAEVSLTDIPTKLVTLGPERATVVREVSGVQIKHGHNEITIYGLDPQVDSDSIHVAGNGPATITDIQTTTVTQKHLFEELFPDCENEPGDQVVEQEDPDNDFGVDKLELTKVQDELKELNAKNNITNREWRTATKSLECLQEYGNGIKPEVVPISQLSEYLRTFEQERERLSEFCQECEDKVADLASQITKLTRTRDSLQAAFNRARDAAAKPERAARKRKQATHNLVVADKKRRRNDHMRFYPPQVGAVIICLDGFPNLTPGASRRSSITDDPEKVEATGSVDLSLTYVTKKAAWVPRYELNLKTPTSSGTASYLAEYHNFSSEAWTDAKLVLSTSQTSFSGIGEKLPLLKPWSVKVTEDDKAEFKKKSDSWTGGLTSQDEINAKWARERRTMLSKPVIGNNLSSMHPTLPVPDSGPYPMSMYNRTWQQTQPQAQQMAQQQQLNNIAQVQQQQAQQQAVQRQQRLAQAQPPPNPGLPNPRLSSDLVLGIGGRALEERNSEESEEDGDDLTLDGASFDLDFGSTPSPPKALAFQEPSRQEYGMTTSYDIPGHRTLRPSPIKRRHVIASIDFPKVEFSHVIIPKLRAAAFLRAKIFNASSLPLLRGNAGLNLDGTFMGTAVVPDCRADSVFSLNLGVDPGIQVSYPTPIVRRTAGGFFNTEDRAIFRRTCRINNTKAAAGTLVVLDQVPVSEDNRLKLNILEPAGLEKESDSVPVTLDSSAAKAGWGKGKVTMLKGGEIMWQLTVEKGMEIRLTLEYEAKMSNGQKMIGA
ncbi:hypothetical protein FQN53_005757 [Emmonsiellopsis sp. PD_33]|nr:hypothetical protein FQN53_005757 [Emmonsiellopsis sp. PD_33]